MVLETAQERVKLLREGQTGKQIESRYIHLNSFKIVGGNLLRTQEGSK